MADDIAINRAQRTTLFSLQQIDRDSAVAQRRLSFGRRIVDVTDGATDFFQARGLSNRIGDTRERNDQIDQAISALQTFVGGAQGLQELLSIARGHVLRAEANIADISGATEAQTRATITTDFNETLTKFYFVAQSLQYNGLNLLIDQDREFTVRFSKSTEDTLVVQGRNLFSSGGYTIRNGNLFDEQVINPANNGSITFANLHSTFAHAGFSVIYTTNASDLDLIRQTLDTASDRLERIESYLGSNVALLQARLDFSRTYANNLTIGRDKIVLADVNEEAAVLTTLRTRNQIGIGALASNAESEQQLLRLLS